MPLYSRLPLFFIRCRELVNFSYEAHEAFKFAVCLLVTLRDVQLLRGTIDDLDGELQVSATRLHASASVWQYSFEVTHAQQTVAHGLAMVAISSSRRA